MPSEVTYLWSLIYGQVTYLSSEGTYLSLIDCGDIDPVLLGCSLMFIY